MFLSPQLQAGRTHVTYALSDLYDLSPTLTFPHLFGARLEVTALLKDDSGRLRQVSDQSCVFTTSQYELVFPRLDRTVHPDVPFYPLQVGTETFCVPPPQSFPSFPNFFLPPFS